MAHLPRFSYSDAILCFIKSGTVLDISTLQLYHRRAAPHYTNTNVVCDICGHTIHGMHAGSTTGPSDANNVGWDICMQCLPLCCVMQSSSTIKTADDLFEFITGLPRCLLDQYNKLYQQPNKTFTFSKNGVSCVFCRKPKCFYHVSEWCLDCIQKFDLFKNICNKYAIENTSAHTLPSNPVPTYRMITSSFAPMPTTQAALTDPTSAPNPFTPTPTQSNPFLATTTSTSSFAPPATQTNLSMLPSPTPQTTTSSTSSSTNTFANTMSDQKQHWSLQKSPFDPASKPSINLDPGFDVNSEWQQSRRASLASQANSSIWPSSSPQTSTSVNSSITNPFENTTTGQKNEYWPQGVPSHPSDTTVRPSIIFDEPTNPGPNYHPAWR